MKTFMPTIIILSLIISFCSMVYATDSDCQKDCQASATTQGGCPVNTDDPFAKETRLKEGPMKGHCIDSNKYRSVHRLTREERLQFGIDPDDNTVEAVANFSKDYKYWVAVIPKEKVQHTVFQLMRFNPKIPFYHGQVRLTVAKEGRPIKLIEQTKKTERKTEVLDDDLVYSLFAARPVEYDGAFSPLKGMQDYYASTYTLSANKDQAEWTLGSHVDLFQYGLNFNHEKTLALMSHGITRGTEHEVNDPYKTTTSSCINAAFEAVRAAANLPPSNPVKLFAESSDPVKALEDIGLMESIESAKLPNYADEKGPLNADELTCPQNKERCHVMNFSINTYSKSSSGEAGAENTIKTNLNDLLNRLEGCDMNVHRYQTTKVNYYETRVVIRSNACRFLSEKEVRCKPYEEPVDFHENGNFYRVCKNKELLSKEPMSLPTINNGNKKSSGTN